MNTSPGCIVSTGWRFRISGMIPIKLPRCIGMCSAWHKVVPCLSNSAVEQSRRSLMLVEKLARTRASPISSAIEDNALPITSTVIGSTNYLGGRRSWQLQQQIEEPVDGCGGTGHNQGRRVHLLDDRGSFDAVAGGKPLAVVERTGNERAGLAQPYLAAANLRRRGVGPASAAGLMSALRTMPVASARKVTSCIGSSSATKP